MLVWVLTCIWLRLLHKQPVGLDDRRVPDTLKAKRVSEREKIFNDLTCAARRIQEEKQIERVNCRFLAIEKREERNGSKRHWMRNSRLAILIATIPNAQHSLEHKPQRKSSSPFLCMLSPPSLSHWTFNVNQLNEDPLCVWCYCK